MKTLVRIVEDLSLVETRYPHGTGDNRLQIITGRGRVSVVIDGPSNEVNALVVPVPTIPAAEAQTETSYMSEVRRALITLGFSEAERSTAIDLDRLPRALKTFSTWIDRLQVLPEASEELKATWTQFIAARFAGDDPPATTSTVEEASGAAWHAITMQLRYFPPRARADSATDNSYAEEWSELSEWRESAKQRGWLSPLNLRGHSATDEAELVAWRTAASLHGLTIPKQLESMVGFDFAQFNELLQWRAAAKENGIASAQELSESGKINFGQFVDRKVSRDWQDETGQESPKLAGQRIGSLVNDVHALTQRIQSLLDERELWRERTNCEHPKEFASEWSEVEHWKTETGCLTAMGAGELIRQLREFKQRVAAAEQISNELSAKLHERDQDWLTANAEIDRVKAAARTLGLVSDDAKELAKVRAELQSKRREAQTEKERAVTAESMFHIEQKKHDDTKKELASVDTILSSARSLCADIRDALNVPPEVTGLVAWCKELNVLLDSAIIPQPKPGKVEPGQRWMIVEYKPTVIEVNEHGFVRTDSERVPVTTAHHMLNSGIWVYLGK